MNKIKKLGMGRAIAGPSPKIMEEK